MPDVPRSKWWIVVGSVFGLFFSTGPLLQFSFGAFLKPVSQTFNVDRGTISLALLMSLCGSAIAIPLVGRIVDRFGVRPVAPAVVTLFGLAIAGIGCSRSITTYFIWFIVAGIIGAGQTPLIYAKAIASAFDERRGLALGIGMAGVGMGAALLPKLAQWLVLRWGWQHAYVALGALTVLVAVPPISFCFRDLPGAVHEQHSLTVHALRLPLFWKMASAFFVVAASSSGVMTHLIPLLTDQAKTEHTAAAAVAAGGMALVVGRLVAGYSLDRFYAPYVALVFFVMPLLGIITLIVSVGLPTAILASGLVGMGLGAEMDLIAYLQSRFLGLTRFAETYGYLLMIFMVGSGIGPFVMGMSFRYTGSYAAALTGFAVALVPACLVFLTFGAYRHALL